MKANDLRVGSWVQCIDGRFKVTKILEHFVAYRGKKDYPQECKYEDLEPIPLTAEILAKCGFQLLTDFGDSIYFLHPKMKKFYVGIDHEWVEFGAYKEPGQIECIMHDNPALTFLHQLQNLYFALTGNELEFNANP